MKNENKVPDLFDIIRGCLGSRTRSMLAEEVCLVLGEINLLTEYVIPLESYIFGLSIRPPSFDLGEKDKRQIAQLVILQNLFSKSVVTLKNKLAISMAMNEGIKAKTINDRFITPDQLTNNLSKSGQMILSMFDTGELSVFVQRRPFVEHRENSHSFEILAKIYTFSNTDDQQACLRSLSIEIGRLKSARDEAFIIFEKYLQMPSDC